MSRGCVRLGDNSAGHCFFPRPPITGSNNVFINGIPATTVGDYLPVHTCGKSSHDGVISGGSSSVFVNGKPIARTGDPVSCGDTLMIASTNVFAGG